MDFDLVAFLQLQGVDDRRRQTDGQAVAPLRDLYGDAPRYTSLVLYILVIGVSRRSQGWPQAIIARG